MSELIRDWVTKAGYRAVIVKHNSLDGGYHCGYVSIPPIHPLFGIHFSDVEFDPDVHGGITYSGDRGEKGTWWYGFDCHHVYDTILQCNEPYVVRECEWLAKQLMTEWEIERTPYESEIDIVSDGRVIATVEAGDGKEGVAAIIAAAPDMLEALVGAKWLIKCYVAKPEGYEEYQAVVKAISKARGEE